ncbi:MAG: M20/M25/M40 family metallo-hydrolase, partial [Hyphomicrobiaceae bacterium]
GKQGHVAYQHLARNPVRGMTRALSALQDEPLDQGSDHFQPSNLEVTTIDVGNKADNVIPARVTAIFNVRFNDHHSHSSLRDALAERVSSALAGTDFTHQLEFYGTSEVFLTEPGPLVDCIAEAIHSVTGRTPAPTTSGGTSDARFIKNYCPVLEFGLLNRTAHQVDEHVPVAHLEQLTEIYQTFIARYFDTFAGS